MIKKICSCNGLPDTKIKEIDSVRLYYLECRKCKLSTPVCLSEVSAIITWNIMMNYFQDDDD